MYRHVSEVIGIITEFSNLTPNSFISLLIKYSNIKFDFYL